MTQGGPLPLPIGSEPVEVDGHGGEALRVLSEVAASLACEHDLEGLLTRFLRTMIRLCGASAGAVRVLTGDGQHLRLLASVGLPADMVERERLVQIDCGACGAAVHAGEVRHGREFATCVEKSSAAYFGNCKGLVAVPLQFNGKVLGVYNLFMSEERAIPEDVTLLFRSISEQLGMALENARLMRENLRMTLMNERQMMANEVHDSLAQTMAYMRMRVELLRETLEGEGQAKALKYASDIQQALEEAYSGLRDLLTQFRNRMDPLGLEHAFADIVAGFHDRTGIALEFENRIPDLDLSVDQEVQVFHIVHEALANVVRHSGAARARLSLDVIEGSYAFTVEDDGRGVFVVGAQPDLRHHFGISIMSERHDRDRQSADRGGAFALAGSDFGRPGAGRGERAVSELIKVILVDDHTLFRKGLAELLEGRGGIAVVGATGNPDDAVALVGAKQPDVLPRGARRWSRRR
jgi:two-component system nitrate/nitrite sensor histidine kinase NarX